jgi:trimeric autotransporter adhesin
MHGLRAVRQFSITGAALLWTACSGVTDANRAEVASVTLDPPSSTTVVGSMVTFEATVKDAAGHALENREVFWASENPSVAEMTSTPGVFRTLSIGTTRIAASSEGKSAVATLTVSPTPVASVVVLPAVAQVRIGSSVPLHAVTYDDQNNELTGRTSVWASSDPSVATVDDQGNVTGVAIGNITISATSEGKTGTASVEVTEIPVGSVTVQPATASIIIGGTVELTATVRDDRGNPLEGRTIDWSSQSPNVATVSDQGVVSGVGAGVAEIRASTGGRTGRALITVAPPPVATVTVTPPEVTLLPEQTARFTATLRDADGNILTGREVVWSSDPTVVASVTQDGTVTARAPGVATITATSEGKRGSAAVTVLRTPVERIVISPASAEMEPGSTQQFIARVYDRDGNELFGRVVTWQSSNTDVLTIDAGGFAMALEEGRATVTARCEGKSDNAEVRVRDQ